MKKTVLRWSLFFFTLCTMALIFYFSSENGEKSGAASDGVTAFFMRLFSGKEIDELSPKLADTVSLVIRKLAHFSEFCLLGLFFGGFIRTYNMRESLCFVIPSVFCLVYAAFDEFHQLFVSGRCGSVRDVAIDFAGALFAGAILALLSFVIKRKKEKNTATD